MEKRLKDHDTLYALQKGPPGPLSSIKLLISELAVWEPKKVTSVVKEQELILQALGTQRMTSIVE